MLKIAVFLLLIAATVIVAFLFSRSAPPAEGTAAPGFMLPSPQGPVSLSDYRGQWVVLYFYPKDQTTGCTREARNFEADQPKYAERHAVILGVSLDSVDSHKRFCVKEGLNFKLLSDSNHAVTKAYGSLVNFGVVKIAARHTFIIDPKGNIAKSYMSVDFNRHSAEVLAELDKLQAGPESANR